MPPKRDPNRPKPLSSEYGKTYSARLRYQDSEEAQLMQYIDTVIGKRKQEDAEYNFRSFLLDLTYDRGITSVHITDPTDVMRAIQELSVSLGQEIKELRQALEDARAQGFAVPNVPQRKKPRGGIAQEFLKNLSEGFHEDN